MDGHKRNNSAQPHQVLEANQVLEAELIAMSFHSVQPTKFLSSFLGRNDFRSFLTPNLDSCKVASFYTMVCSALFSSNQII